jgi:hypothetical protein
LSSGGAPGKTTNPNPNRNQNLKEYWLGWRFTPPMTMTQNYR